MTSTEAWPCNPTGRASVQFLAMLESMPRRLRAPDLERLRADAELFARLRDERDPVDRAVLVERFLPLARRLARRYQGAGEPFDDLLQVACLGLVKAIDRFDPERGIAFSSFALPTILGELRRHFRDRTWSVRVPRELQELALRVDRAVTDLEAQRGRAPTVTEIAAVVRASEERVLEALEAFDAYRSTSLDAPPGRGAGEEPDDALGDVVGVHEDGFEHAEHRATLDGLLRVLTPREREVLRLRFEEDLTQGEIGARIGCSQMHVSRIIRTALARLQALAGVDGTPATVGA
jgi:RNA polymerase sigma-B factor